MSSFEMEPLFKLEKGCIRELKHAHLHPHKKSVGLFARYVIIICTVQKLESHDIFFSQITNQKVD